MNKCNCWEFKSCGRYPGGPRISELGVCPAATEMRGNGMNGGSNGGRACWAIAGTPCGGKVQGVFAAKLINCITCDFYQRVQREEGKDFQHARAILASLGEHL